MAFGYRFPKDFRGALAQPAKTLADWRRGQDNLLKRLHVEQTFRMLQPSPADSILEIGAALLYYSGEIAKRAGCLVALDYFDGFGAPMKTSRFAASLRAVRGDAHDLPFRNASFSKVFISEVFPVLAEPERCVREIYRVLQPGGSVTTVHGTAHRRMADAMATPRGQVLLKTAHERWGTPTDFEGFQKAFVKLHGTNPAFFEDRDGIVISLLRDAGFEVAELEWAIGPSAQLEYCMLMLEAMAETGRPDVGRNQVRHLQRFRQLERTDGRLDSGLTFFCRGVRS